MTLAEYQKAAMRTKGTYAHRIDQLNNAQCGMCGEAGEFADLYKKFAFQHGPCDREHFLREAGDCLWYIALAADFFDTTIEEIATINIQKLLARYPDGYDPIRSNNRKLGDT